MGTKGKHAVNLTHNPAIDDHPDWCAGRSKIVFERVASSWTERQIFVMNADGSEQHPGSRHARRLDRHVRPDRKQIAYISGNDVSRANADGTASSAWPGSAAPGISPTAAGSTGASERALMDARGACAMVAAALLSVACAQLWPCRRVRGPQRRRPHAKHGPGRRSTSTPPGPGRAPPGASRRTPESDESPTPPRCPTAGSSPTRASCLRTGVPDLARAQGRQPPALRHARQRAAWSPDRSASCSSARGARRRSPRSTPCARTARTSSA